MLDLKIFSGRADPKGYRERFGQAIVVCVYGYCRASFMGFNFNDDQGASSPRKEIRVLVVDDQPEHFESLRGAAEMYNPEFSVELRLVCDRQEALSVTSSWHPSVVLLDLHVVSDALDLVQQLSKIGSSVLATSEVRISDMSHKVAQYGGVGYQPKSDNPDDLEALLSYIASIAGPMPSSH